MIWSLDFLFFFTQCGHTAVFLSMHIVRMRLLSETTPCCLVGPFWVSCKLKIELDESPGAFSPLYNHGKLWSQRRLKAQSVKFLCLSVDPFPPCEIFCNPFFVLAKLNFCWDTPTFKWFRRKTRSRKLVVNIILSEICTLTLTMNPIHIFVVPVFGHTFLLSTTLTRWHISRFPTFSLCPDTLPNLWPRLCLLDCFSFVSVMMVFVWFFKKHAPRHLAFRVVFDTYSREIYCNCKLTLPGLDSGTHPGTWSEDFLAGIGCCIKGVPLINGWQRAVAYASTGWKTASASVRLFSQTALSNDTQHKSGPSFSAIIDLPTKHVFLSASHEWIFFLHKDVFSHLTQKCQYQWFHEKGHNWTSREINLGNEKRTRAHKKVNQSGNVDVIESFPTPWSLVLDLLDICSPVDQWVQRTFGFMYTQMVAQ